MTDPPWVRLEPFFSSPRPDGRDRLWADSRAVLNGVLYVLRLGRPARPLLATLDLPWPPPALGAGGGVRDRARRDGRGAGRRADRCHVNYAILDSGWEGEFCRVVEGHPRVRAYVKNHNLGFAVPYRLFTETRLYRPDFLLRVEDGHGEEDLLTLVVEIKGYRGEDAVEKKATMESYWVPGVNRLGTHGRWAFAELTTLYEMEPDLNARIAQEVSCIVAAVVPQGVAA